MRKITAALAFILCGTLICSCGMENKEAAAVPDIDTQSSAYEADSVIETARTSESVGTVTERSAAETYGENDLSVTEISKTGTDVSSAAEREKPKAEVPVLTASNVDCGTNRLEWTSVEGASSYVLYLYNGRTGTFEEYGEMSGTACNDKRLSPDTKYVYGVAAKFSDGSMGKMSEPAAVYTYSHRASRVQGNWIYYYDSAGKSLRRISRGGDTDEKLFDSPEGMDFPFVSLNYVYFSVNDDEGYSFYRAGLDGKNKKLLVGFFEDSDYYLDDIEVYDDVVYYSYHGSHMETDRDRNYFCAVNSDEKAADEFYSGYRSVYFFEDENGGFCAAWRGEEINPEASEEVNEIITDPTGDYFIYRAETGKTETVKLPEELLGAANIQAVKYIGGEVWVYANFVTERKFGCIKPDGSFEETKLPENADFPDVSYDGKKIYFQTNTGGPDESGRYSWINTGKTLCVLSEGNTEELSELYADPTFDFKAYEPGREYILYTDSGGDRFYLNISEGKTVRVP